MSRGGPATRVGGLGRTLLGLAGITLLSRVMGFGRWLVFSKTVGDTCLGDVYNAANSLPNALFEIVAGGVLASVVVPVVARHVAAGRREQAARTTSALLTWTLVLLTPVAVLALVLAGAYARLYSSPSCVGGADTLSALLIMFVPQVWLYGVAVVCAGVLQAHGRFLAAATGPLLSAVVVLITYLAYAAITPAGAEDDLGLLTSPALLVLGLGTTAGVVVLAATTAIPLLRSQIGLRPTLQFAAEDRQTVLLIAAAGVAGLVAQQLSVLLINWAAATGGDPGALTRFTWANALYLLPYAVLVAPLLQVLFPRLSAAAEAGPEQVRAVLHQFTGPVIVLSCLGSALLLATAIPVARVFVLGPGSGDTLALAGPIMALAPAVIGFSLLGLGSRTLLSEHRAGAAGTVTAVAWLVVIVGAALARLLLSREWLVVGLAGSVSLGMIVGAVSGQILLARLLPGRTGGARALAAGLLATMIAAGPLLLLGWQLTDVGLTLAVLLAGASALLAAGLFVGTLWFGHRSLARAALAALTRTRES